MKKLPDWETHSASLRSDPNPDCLLLQSLHSVCLQMYLLRKYSCITVFCLVYILILRDRPFVKFSSEDKIMTAGCFHLQLAFPSQTITVTCVYATWALGLYTLTAVGRELLIFYEETTSRSPKFECWNRSVFYWRPPNVINPTVDASQGTFIQVLNCSTWLLFQTMRLHRYKRLIVAIPLIMIKIHNVWSELLLNHIRNARCIEDWSFVGF